ncbi:hydrolase [Herminiimonas sp. KBW02]|uniref:amidohydrolase n=1 Tax=Herminiimonas sp. KBW02 TaxID=2153363 RepID=UPI000F59E105|nr:amidohydrolase [Herminiimonas sp. KBW02]RQO33234.1 hydrolase [Herminiimonas sp. KBW02]
MLRDKKLCKLVLESVVVSALTAFTSFAYSQNTASPRAETIYLGGSILTMAGDTPHYAEAVAIQNGKIINVGSKAAALKLRDERTRVVDLAGKTLLPGFIDAHGHAWMTGFQKLSANLLPPPDGKGSDIPTLVSLLKDWQSKNQVAIDKVGWIIGFGYDDSQLAEKRHPTATDLDQVSTDIPVVVIHQSSHLASMNHKALEMAGITSESPNPAGGVIRRLADGRTPDGVLEEMAFFGPMFKVLGSFDQDVSEKIALAGVDYYMQFGFTTAQEGRASKQITQTWNKLAKEGKLKIDVAAYPDLQAEQAFMSATGTKKSYSNHFRVAGVKLSLDGSPQGKTAWLSKPYVHAPAGQPADYRGYPAIPKNDDLQLLVNQAFKHNWQILAHTNGDAAADALINAVAKAEKTYGKGDRRTVMIHAQTVREDQLDRMKQLGIIPSFFSMHTFYWGDWHRDETLGKDRAFRISPTQSALKRGMWFTEHHDAPVALPSSIMILHTTVNRTTRSGAVLGEDQRVSPYIALKSITDWASRQYFEEKNKGTISVGKLADLVILDKNPLKVDPATIRDIKVLETIKEGKTIFSQD